MIDTMQIQTAWGPREIRLWAPREEIEPSAIQQLINLVHVECVAGVVCAMPDVHTGMGATIGSVIPMYHGIIPAAVGVDIGCGMLATPLNVLGKDLRTMDLKAIRETIESVIPVGVGKGHTKAPPSAGISWINSSWSALSSLYRRQKKEEGTHNDLKVKALHQMATLGSGNHFIEISVEEEDSPKFSDKTWLVIHSGSRGIGHDIASTYIKLAKSVCTADLPDRNLAWFRSTMSEYKAYLQDCEWAQNYAHANRRSMKDLILLALKKELGIAALAGRIDCHHNYATPYYLNEPACNMVVRKGAINAASGVHGIIPGSMGDRTYIVTGNGNGQGYVSAPHGAGRVMSRSAAKKSFTVGDLCAQTVGVESRKDKGILDEAPSAYKPIETVIERSFDLVTIARIMKQVICVKG